MKRFILIFLALILLVGCSTQPTEQITDQPDATEAPTVPEQTIDPILSRRRDIAESYMRQMLSVLWSPEEDILYTTANKVAPEDADPGKQFLLQADRVYRGVPYSFAGSTLAAFTDYAQPEGDIYKISGLSWKALNGNSKSARIGNDGSSALALAWCQVGNSVKIMSTSNMTMDYGFLPVGQYATTAKKLEETDRYCAANGQQLMFESYAQLLKADGLVKSTSSGGHAMMAVSVSTVYNDDGTINGQESTVTILEQSKEHFLKEVHSYDEALGQEIYHIGGIDEVFSFEWLYTQGYLPITCKELTETTEPRQANVGDSEKDPKIETALAGFVDCNHHIDTVTVTILDENGQVVQEAAVQAVRGKNMVLEVKRIANDDPDTIRGFIDISQLDGQKYRFVLTCRLVNGQEVVTRDYEFRLDG